MTRALVDGEPRWCDYRDEPGHAGEHVHYLGEVMLPDPSPAYVVSLTLMSVSRHPFPVLTVGGRYAPQTAAELDWPDVDRLARMLRDAHRRYA